MTVVATVNVNGIRAAANKGFIQWLADSDADIVLLQEVRAPEETVQALFREPIAGKKWQVVHYPCAIKGRAGVAIASKNPIIAARAGVASPEPDIPVDSGRWLEADIETDLGLITVVSLYAHSGEVGTEKIEQKYAHFKLLDQRMQTLLTSGKSVIVAGDFNIVHTEIDIKNWKPNHNKTAGVLDTEIAHLDYWFETLGWVDVVRKLSGSVQGPYSWWSYRGKAFDNDAGWRIDYQAVTPALAKHAVEFRIDKAADATKRFSDHAPVVVTYK